MKNNNQKLIRGLTAVLLIAGLISTATHLRAQEQGVPDEMVYSGQLTDAYGDALNGKYYLRFILYDAPKGGSGLATQTFVRTIQDGNFSVPISGFGHALSADQPVDYAMEIRVAETQGGLSQSSSVMSRRQPLRTVPYALVAGDVASVQGDLSVQGQVDGPINGSVEQVNVQADLRTTNSLVVVSNLTADTLTATNIVNVGTFNMPSGKLDADTMNMSTLGKDIHLFRPMGFGAYQDVTTELTRFTGEQFKSLRRTGTKREYSAAIIQDNKNYPYPPNTPPKEGRLAENNTTVDCWFKVGENGTGTDRPLLTTQKDDWSRGNHGITIMVNDSDKILITGGNRKDQGEQPKSMPINQNVNDSKWHHLCVTIRYAYYYNGSDWEWKLVFRAHLDGKRKGIETSINTYGYKPNNGRRWRVLGVTKDTMSIRHIGMWTSSGNIPLSHTNIKKRYNDPGTKVAFDKMHVMLPCTNWTEQGGNDYVIDDQSGDHNNLEISNVDDSGYSLEFNTISHTLPGRSKDGFYMLYAPNSDKSADISVEIPSAKLHYTLGKKGKAGELLTFPIEANKEFSVTYPKRPKLFFVPFKPE